MPETTPLIKAALNLRVGAGFDVYERTETTEVITEDSTETPAPVEVSGSTENSTILPLSYEDFNVNGFGYSN